jgi:hypothetical protein
MSADDDIYKNQLEENIAFYDLYLTDFIKRLDFCRDNGANTAMLTGNVEPQQNMHFLKDLGIAFKLMKSPFPIVEMQTTGVGIDQQRLRFFRNHLGMSTISLSLFSFDNEISRSYRGDKAAPVDIAWLCSEIKRYDFNLRLSCNLCDGFDTHIESILNTAKDLGVDQVTLRKLYTTGDGSPQDAWVREHGYDRLLDEESFLTKLPKLRILEYGAMARSYRGMSIAYDMDCMAKGDQDAFKYPIVRPNGKLYSSWDDPASLVF